ncbi:mitochondrial chaperone bcs1 [Melanomma pulvis-pyrius CBS 109.77]|uniref:Mitochondrial chaperone bcs1 n=1 Tax=Melanomma pulvis-pyrius CBS 109.77 TaxID=1314802 RepID=A0A6A6WXJ6_9PLEO|nr:mitochondrial chaperone bcs1 [Melanomma pulvis-pyrius CBS 109.77]
MPTDEKVSLSTLLNVLDGIGSPEGRVLIMTTNYIERIDPALIRPGRVDTKAKLHFANKEMLSQLFFFIYNLQPKDNLPQLAQEFVVKVPKLEFSPAEIMSLLIANKQRPRHAIARACAKFANALNLRRLI